MEKDLIVGCHDSKRSPTEEVELFPPLFLTTPMASRSSRARDRTMPQQWQLLYPQPAAPPGNSHLCLSLKRSFVITFRTHPDNPVYFHLRILNLPHLQSSFFHKGSHSQVPGVKTWTGTGTPTQLTTWYLVHLWDSSMLLTPESISFYCLINPPYYIRSYSSICGLNDTGATSSLGN